MLLLLLLLLLAERIRLDGDDNVFVATIVTLEPLFLAFMSAEPDVVVSECIELKMERELSM